MKRLESRLAWLEKKSPRLTSHPEYLSFPTEEAYRAAILTAQSRGRPLAAANVKVYIGFDVDRV